MHGPRITKPDAITVLSVVVQYINQDAIPDTIGEWVAPAPSCPHVPSSLTLITSRVHNKPLYLSYHQRLWALRPKRRLRHIFTSKPKRLTSTPILAIITPIHHGRRQICPRSWWTSWSSSSSSCAQYAIFPVRRTGISANHAAAE